MKATTDKAADRSGVLTRLDTIRMGEHERWRANGSLRNGEFIAELVLRAVADMRAIACYVEHVTTSLASWIKAMFAKPVKH